ncbi:MAG: hypothetical protein QGG48_07465 [Desulfatiglandales bacterium]|jgi:HTH-type transcriptional regulator/antitoxin HigA|nr:hypothetical protein [Desulfatiglandales bacterium]
MEKLTVIAKDIRSHLAVISPIFSIHNEDEYDLAVERLNSIIDEVGTHKQHPLYGLLDTLGTVIHAYEDKHHQIEDCIENDVGICHRPGHGDCFSLY